MIFLLLSFLLVVGAAYAMLYGIYRLAVKLGWIPKAMDE